MVYAPGIILRPWTVGGTTTTEAGEALFTRAKVTASRSLMLWGATGWRYESSTKTITSTEGAQVSGDLPVCDQSGWRTENNAIIDVASVPGSYTHVYTIKVSQFRKDSAGREVPVGEERTYANVFIPTGDGSPVDLDTLLPVGTVAGGVVLVPDTWSARLDALEAGGGGGGGGGGVSEVSGTITLPVDGPRLLEMYTIGSATINGETFAVDTALVARRTAAGVWQVAVVDSADWRAFVAAQPTTVTATAPTFTDMSGTSSDAYTIPSVAGVTYKIAGLAVAAGTYPGSGTVSITAAASDGYALSGTASWQHTYSTAVGDTPVTASAPVWVDDSASGGGTWTTPTITGVTYSPASGTATSGQTVTVTAAANPGYALSGTASWQHTFPAVFLTSVFADTFTDTDGVNLGSHLADTGQAWGGATLGNTVHGNRLRCATASYVRASHGILSSTSLRGEFTYHTYPSDDGPLFVCFRSDDTSTNRLGIFISRESTRTIVQWAGPVTATTFNNGNGTNPWAYAPGADFALAQTFEFAVIYTPTTITVYCDNVRILEGTHSWNSVGTFLALASSTSSWTPAGVGGLDNLRVWTP